MAKPFDQLPAILAKRKAEVVSLVNTVVRAGGTAASDYYTEETAVDTGEARSNWVGTLNQPFEGRLPAYHPYAKLNDSALSFPRKSETANRDSARAQNRAALAGFDARRHRSFFLRNNTPHIGLINQGHSPQTLADFFEIGVQRAIGAMTGLWRLSP